jgi:hypothetical protein
MRIEKPSSGSVCSRRQSLLPRSSPVAVRVSSLSELQYGSMSARKICG